MTLTCDCGKTVEDWRGARGHVQFSETDGHGDKMDVPDGWKDLFDEDEAEGQESENADEDESQDPDLPDVCRKCEDRDRVDGSMMCEQCSDDEATDDEVEDAVEDVDDSPGRLKTALFDDVRALWGGHE